VSIGNALVFFSFLSAARFVFGQAIDEIVRDDFNRDGVPGVHRFSSHLKNLSL